MKNLYVSMLQTLGVLIRSLSIKNLQPAFLWRQPWYALVFLAYVLVLPRLTAQTPELLYYRFDESGANIPNEATTPPSGTSMATIIGNQSQGGEGQCDGALIGTGGGSSTNYVNTGWVPDLGGSSWTISLWINNVSNYSQLWYIFGEANTNGFRCFTNGVAGADNYWLRGGGLTDVPVPGGAAAGPQIITFVYDNTLSNVKAYLNGTLVNTVAQENGVNITGTGLLKVGGYGSNFGLAPNSLMDEFRLYNRALSAEEVAAIAGNVCFCYLDIDGDGYGDASDAGIESEDSGCPMGRVGNKADCDDNNSNINPGSPEICDNMDNDCNGLVDDGSDLDGDGYSTMQGDCDDCNSAVNPGAADVCNGIDDDCNGQIDELPPTIAPWSNGNIGAANGTASFACSPTSQQEYQLTAKGVSSPTADVMHFVYQQLCGNGSITARVANVTGGGWAGVMMRESLSPGAKKAVLKTQLSNFIRRELRTTANGTTSSLNFNRPVHQWLQLTRSGNVLTGYTSPDGNNWDFAFTATISMGSCIQVGFFSESINVNAVTTASFTNVVVTGTTPLLAEITDNNFNGVDQVLGDINLTLAPNPSQGLVNLQFLAAPKVPVTIEVFNLLGECISRLTNQQLDGASLQLDLSGQAAGVYFVHISAADATPVVKQLVLTH